VEEKRIAYKILVAGQKGNIPFGSARSTFGDNIKLNIRGTEWGGMDWVIWLRRGATDRLY
jgi:hypothetical protein